MVNAKWWVRVHQSHFRNDYIIREYRTGSTSSISDMSIWLALTNFRFYLIASSKTFKEPFDKLITLFHFFFRLHVQRDHENISENYVNDFFKLPWPTVNCPFSNESIFVYSFEPNICIDEIREYFSPCETNNREKRKENDFQNYFYHFYYYEYVNQIMTQLKSIFSKKKKNFFFSREYVTIVSSLQNFFYDFYGIKKEKVEQFQVILVWKWSS